MRIGVTGATGFVGRAVVARLTAQGHKCVCWFRPGSDLGGIDTKGGAVVWVEGELNREGAAESLVQGCDAVVHAALDRPGAGFRGAEGELIGFVRTNLLGTLALIEAARSAGVGRFVFISTGAVHERIVPGRPLDETHPAWPKTHYGAHKAAIEAFVHSYGFGQDYPICALRPTGIYGLAHRPSDSKWHDLVRDVAWGKDVNCQGGGKEVHVDDVALAVDLLLKAEAHDVAGESFECCDRYISQLEVATLARDLSGGKNLVTGDAPTPKNQIITKKLEGLGMTFGGKARLEQTIRQLLEATAPAIQ